MSSIDFNELSYEQLFLNPMVVPPKKSPEDYYDTWKLYPEFLELTLDIDRNKLFRYIPLVYGQKSPLHGVITDIKKIKGVAAELAGFKKVDGDFLSNVKEILSCQNREVNKMIIRYITLHKNAKYTEYCILREAQFNLGVRVVETQDDKDLKNFRNLSPQLDELTQFLLSKDTNDTLQEDFYEYHMEDRIKLRPEDIARNRKEGKPLVS